MRHTVWLVALALGCSGAGTSSAGQPEIVQVVSGLDTRESVVFSADGKWLFVSNCASGEFGADKHVGFASGQSSISKLSVSPEGVLAITTAKFVTKLSGTLGLTVAPKAVGPYPAGSIFICCGGALVVGDDGSYVSD